MSNQTKGRKRWFFVLAMSLSIMVALLLCEIVVRFLFPYMTPDTLRESSIQYVPSIFSKHRLKPMQRVLSVKPRFKSSLSKEESEKSQVKYLINNIGYRGVDVSLQKPADVIRIVFLGGSSVFDQHATEGNDWPQIVGRKLRGKTSKKIEVINAGIPMHTAFDSLGRLYSQLWMLNPDYILLYNGWNDIKYFRKVTLETPLIYLYSPYDDLANPFLNYYGTLDRFFTYSQLYVKVRNRYFAFNKQIGSEGIVHEGEFRDQYSQLAVKQYKLNVELFVDASRNIGAIPILLTQATLVSPQNSQEEKELIGYHYVKLTHEALVNAYHDTYRVIRTVGEDKGVVTLDLAEKLNGRRKLFADHVHTTQKGSEEIAQSVAEFLLQQLNKQET